MAAALRLIVKEPEPGTTFFINAVVSFVRTTANTILLAVHCAFVTTREVAAAAKLTVPAILLIVCAPVVPPAVMARSKPRDPFALNRQRST